MLLLSLLLCVLVGFGFASGVGHSSSISSALAAAVIACLTCALSLACAQACRPMTKGGVEALYCFLRIVPCLAPHLACNTNDSQNSIDTRSKMLN